MLSAIELVTFDCFGTLLDWRQPLVWLGLDPDEHWGDFESECRDLQHPARPFARYRRVLEEAALRIAPTSSPRQRTTFARRFGEAPAFLDASALPLVQDIVPIGVLSNCDAEHQLDAMRSLGVTWDVCVLSADVEAYKPHVQAWDAMVSRVRESMQIEPEHWLHVSAFDDYDLALAKAFGLKTAFIRRASTGSEHAEADAVFSSLHELARALGDAQDGPITYEVRAKPRDEDTLREWVAWMEREHMDRVLATGLVRSAKLESDGSGGLRAVYSLRRRAHLDRYFEEYAPRLRAEGLAKFGDRVTYERSIYRGVARRR
jgi:FMN phosphatase YigB (HAD superfamily)